MPLLNLFGDPDLSAYGGLLDPASLQKLQAEMGKQQAWARTAALLEAGGPSLMPIGAGQAIGRAAVASNQAGSQFLGSQLPLAVQARQYQLKQQQDAEKRKAEDDARARLAGLLPGMADGTLTAPQIGASLATIPGYERTGIDLLTREAGGVRGVGPFIVPPGGMLADREGSVLLSNPARGGSKPERVGMVSPQGQFVALNADDPTIPGRLRSGWQKVEPQTAPAPAPQPTATTAPPTAPTRNASVIDQARAAIEQGADPNQVAERLRNLGINPAELNAPAGARGAIRRDVVRPIDR